jgi:[ribosomal protein S5]-alanine N-acetyltransferase
MLLPHLTGTQISLRPLKRSDITALKRQANDRTISKFMPSIQFPYTAENARRWVNRTLRSARTDSAYQLGIELLSRKDFIGMMGIKNINRVDRNGELEYWLGRSYRGRSYASQAMRLMLRFAFNELNLHRVYAIVAALNTPSIKLLERHGFLREAVWRDATWINNGWHDVYCYGLLETEQGKYE